MVTRKDMESMTKPLYVRSIPLGDGMPKVCVPLTGETLPEVVREAGKAAEAGADLIEWRMDFLKEPCREDSLEEALFMISAAAPDTPLIFTIRTRAEGGNIDLTEHEYASLNQTAAESGKADLIDVEYERDPAAMELLIRKIGRLGALTIASTHDFSGTEDDETLLQTFRDLDASGADIIKMAVMPECESDTDRLMECTRRASSEITEKPVIAMAMGENGVKSRIEGEIFGSSVTFGTTGRASAPGQLPVRELKEKLEEIHRQVT